MLTHAHLVDMVLRYDRLGIEIPPADPDPAVDLTKAFPMPRIPTDKIPECRPHLERGSHLTLYCFTPDDYNEVVAVFKGSHPESGEQLRVEHPAPAGFPWPDAPAEEDVFAPDYAPGEIAEIAMKLRNDAGLA